VPDFGAQIPAVGNSLQIDGQQGKIR